MRSGVGVISFWRMRSLSMTSDPGSFAVSSDRTPFRKASLNVRPIAMTSPTDFICVPSVGSDSGNFSNAHFGIFTTT